MTMVRAGGRLVGRASALAATDAALADAVAGSGALLLVTGEPGIGKSALLAEQARRAAAAGVRVARGAAWSESGAPPYWLWTQVMRGLPPDGLPDALRLLDGVGGAPEQPADRFRLFDAVRGALAAAAPLLITLDDLQWADTESLRLLEFLRRTLAAERILLLGTYRDEEAGPALREVASAATGLPLAGLDAGGVAALMAEVAGPVPGAELAEAVRRRCGGNPLFVRELTRLMVARGDFSPDAGPLPNGVRDTLRLRLDRLSAACLGLLELAAVAGSIVTPTVLAAVGPDDEVTVAGLLDEAEHARVLVTNAGVLRFSHDLYRESVLAQLPAERRALLHAAVGHALHRLAGDGTDPGAIGGAGRLAAHFVAAGSHAAPEALRWSVLAAQEATTRLGHQDAAQHYVVALRLVSEDDPPQRVPLLLQLGESWFRAGDAPAARDAYLRAAELGRRLPDARALAESALGVAALGARSGTDDPVGIGLLEEAAALAPGAITTALRSRVDGQLARALRHSVMTDLDPRAAPIAARAVDLARSTNDPEALAHALHAEHDVLWAPGTAAERLALLEQMAAAAHDCGDADLAAEAVLLQATALIEGGDPDGPARLDHYVRLADRLGSARGHWGALSRQATLAQMAGRPDEAAALADRALELGITIGLPDARGVHSTLRSSLLAIGGPPLNDSGLPADDPMWILLPLLRAWLQVQAGDIDGAVASMRGFSVHVIPVKYDLEMVTITTTVLAAVGTREQRDWAYRTFLPFAGLHALVGGCAAYHGVVDHSLGVLAASLGHATDAAEHFTAAVAAHKRLGTTAWAQLSRNALAELAVPDSTGDPEFRLQGGQWRLDFDGHTALVLDTKGMHDIAALLAAAGRQVHVVTLLGRELRTVGADPVLDRRAATAFRERLTTLAEEIEEAERHDDRPRAARARAERDALTRELRTTAGLGGRPRRLGDETERARKTVTARVHDALRRIERAHPTLARHLRQTIHTGTHCAYLPEVTLRWRL